MSTKIINILKSDTFEEVFELFKTADAEEVIFILPKSSRFVKNPGHFQAIGLEAERSGKKISIMTNDPEISRLASQNYFAILSPPIRTARDNTNSRTKTLNGPAFETERQDAHEESLNNNNHDSLAPNDGGQATLVSAKAEESRTTTGRTVKDIFSSEHVKDLKTKNEGTSNARIMVRTEKNPDSSEESGDITKMWSEREKNHQSSNKLGPIRINRGFFRKIPIIMAGLAIIVLILILYLTLGSAKITIYPRVQELDFKLRVISSVTETGVDEKLNRIPGQRFVDQKNESGTFPTTGQKDVAQKASGKITIFNIGTDEQRLVATTRFRSPDGLIFRIPETIFVPGAKRVGLDVKSGSIESMVYADRPGAEYNITPTRFVVPGFEGGPKFDQFYATSTQPMSGGLVGPAKVVTEQDFAKAQETVRTNLQNKLRDSIRDKTPDLKVIEPIPVVAETPVTNTKVGEAAETLRVDIAGSAESIAFRETDAKELIKSYVTKNSSLVLIDNDLSLEYLNSELSTDKKSLSFDLKVTGKGAAVIDQDKIVKDVLGMKEESIRSYFKNIKEVESAKIILSPFWVKRIPNNTNKVRLTIDM